jgi:transcriptional antiterminator RfaH
MDWKVLYVASRAEKKIQEKLTSLGIECYVPMKKEKKQWSDRKKTVISPLINGYVFVKLSEKNRDNVFKSSGVINFLRYNGKDAVVKQNEIDILRSIEEKGYYVEGHFGSNLKPGDKTKIVSGPFKGLLGVVEHAVNHDTYSISIDSIDYCLKINVPSEILLKTSREK